MREFLRKQSIGSFLSIITIILSLIGMAIYISNGNSNYYHDFNSRVVILSVVAMAIEVVLMVMVRAVGEKQWLDVIYIAVPVLLAVAMITFLSSRIESAGIILGSSLEQGNMEAIRALTQAFIGIGVYLLAIIACMTGSFFSQLRNK
jgi:hypothetical protein